MGTSHWEDFGVGGVDDDVFEGQSVGAASPGRARVRPAEVTADGCLCHLPWEGRPWTWSAGVVWARATL